MILYQEYVKGAQNISCNKQQEMVKYWIEFWMHKQIRS